MAGQSVPFLLAPLLVATAYLLKQATITPYDGSAKGISIYAFLVANPSTGKTPAMNVITNALVEIEQYRQVPPEDSPLTNAASIEGLVEHLSQYICMVGKLQNCLQCKFFIK